MPKYDYLIVGAGLFGSTVAYLLKEYGYKVLVIEKREHVGGNIYDKVVGGINVHKYGPHIFHTNESYVWDFVNRFTKFIPFINSPIAVYKNEVYNLPFNMNTFYQMWKVRTPIEARYIIEEQRKESGIEVPKNLEEQAIYLVGKDIYEKLIKGYTEKQWGRECKDLPPEIIKRIPLRFEYNNNYYDDFYQGIPVWGYTKMISNMLDGVEVILGEDYLQDRSKYGSLAKDIIYTGRIDRFFNYEKGHLEYRCLKFDTEILTGYNFLQGNAVVNYTERLVPYTRVIEHKYFNKDQANVKLTIVTKEYPYEYDKDNYSDRMENECCYPIMDEKNLSLYNKYKIMASHIVNPHSYGGIYFGGRLGSYQYADMDDTIMNAFELCDILIGRGGKDVRFKVKEIINKP